VSCDFLITLSKIDKISSMEITVVAASALRVVDDEAQVIHVIADSNERAVSMRSSSVKAIQEKGDYYSPAESGKAFNGEYERKIPDRFSADTDDLFMRSMVTTYALEGKTCDDKGKNCAPNGSFWMSEATTRAAATEVIGTHKGLTGDAAAKYLDTFFAKAWGHFDVNRTGYVEVIKMPQLMRFLCSDQWMQLGESA